MTNNQSFVSATDFLKEEFKISASEVAARLKVEKHVIDNIRRGSRKADKMLVRDFIKEFPEVERFFATYGAKSQGSDVVHEAMYLYNDGGTMKELVSTQQKLIKAQEKQIGELEREVEKLRAENKLLREIVSGREKGQKL